MQNLEELVFAELRNSLINDKILKTKAIKIINSLIENGCEVVVDKKINKYFNNKLKLAKEDDWKQNILTPNCQ